VNDRDALYSAILKHPAEDTPRLAFADWLEENGDNRYAAFIRKQIELAKVPEWDPLWVRALHRERNSLTGYLYDQFVPTVPEGLEWPPLTSFCRGFPWHVESTGAEPFLVHAQRLFAAIPLQALTIDATERWRVPIDLTALFASPHLARLKQLSFTLTRLAPEAMRQMQACPHLRNLTTVASSYAGFLPGALEKLFRPPLIEQLDSVRLETSSVDWEDLAAGCAAAGGPYRLRSLIVTESSPEQFYEPQVFAAPLLRGLTEFEISSYEMGADNIRALCESPVVNGLQSLALNKTIPGVPGIKVLAGCAALSSLKRLRLAGNRLGPVAAKALAGSPHLSGLQALDLSANPLGDKGAIALAESPCMANLVELNLMHCDIGDKGAEALIDALSADRLLYLDVNSSGRSLSDRIWKKIGRKLGGK
jgi:uncharacterized protein (TIGR02996 family)